MIPPAPRKSPGRTARIARDLRTVAIAVAVLAASGIVWLWMSADAAKRREKVLASIPAFPARGQQERHRLATPQPRATELTPGAPLVRTPVAPPRPPKPDAITSFVLKPSHTVAVVHVNALLNTPLFERIRQCMPDEWSTMSKGSSDLGIDFERDIDRIAVATDGIAMSGFFEGKPIVQTIVAHEGGYEERQYRGNTIWMSQSGGFAQIGNLVLWGPPESMERLVDRAIDPAPEGADPEDIYGDIFVRTDLAGRSARANATMLDAVLAGLNGVTVRANVWDMVALSVEGTPQAGRSVTDLAALARAALSVARQQLDPNDVELATLADLAKVSSSDGALKLDLALPMNDVFDKLHFPCPGAKKVEQAGGASP